MACMQCPSCGEAAMKLVTVPDFKTKFEGVEIRVKDAQFKECSSCREKLYSAPELERWKKIKIDLLESLGQVPTAKRIQELRQSLGLSVADFGLLLGVTRQAVHCWERPNGDGMKYSPTSLLLSVLEAERSGTIESVFTVLLELAHQRGQLTKIVSQSPSSNSSNTKTEGRLRSERPGGAPGFFGLKIAS